MGRRRFLARSGLVFAAGALGSPSGREPRREPERTETPPFPAERAGDWSAVKQAFSLSPDRVHLGALFIATHPRPVREAIERYRDELNRDPVTHLERENAPRQQAVREAAARYLGTHPAEIALTDSTTMGIALVYHGLPLKRGDEVLTTEHDYYATHESLRRAALRSGAKVRRVRLHDGASDASTDAIVGSLLRGVTRRTRALALTWVHSSTGLKLPMAELAGAVRGLNREREPAERILICLDGVHGFGVEDAGAEDLGCDFFMAGCHKWLFGPRGTGIVWGRKDAWARLLPVIPSFMDGESWNAWALEREPKGPTSALRMSPGGFKPFEHQWAVAEAFRFHEDIGKSRIAQRTHELSRRLKEGLAAMPHIKLHTPLADALSAGIVCFEVRGMSTPAVVQRLGEQGIVATATPYAASYPRLSPCIYNTPEDVEAALQALHAMK
jgi:selenocysteine lyase/cysteine desulfurase